MSETPLIGRQVGNYLVTALLGRGGMGEVYLAEHPRIRRKVAIKVLAGSFAGDPRLGRRFLIEAEAATRIAHPNVIEIYDFGELDDGRPYYVMEALAGRDLQAVLQASGKLSAAAALPYVEQVCAGLQAAHEQGVVHRDLKPENIFVLDREPLALKILDFGIAKLLEAEGGVALTVAGGAMGTPLYMAPEQAAGRLQEIGARTDLYSLGVVLYVMLAGRPPFRSEVYPLLLAQHISEPPPPLGQLEPALAPALCQLVHRCLEKDPARRPASAREVAAALKAIVSAEAAETRPEVLPVADRGEPAAGVPGGRDPAAPAPAHAPEPPPANVAPTTTLSASAGEVHPTATPTEGGAVFLLTRRLPRAAPEARPGRRRRPLIIAAALVGLSGIVAAGFTWWAPWQERAAAGVTSAPAAADPPPALPSGALSSLDAALAAIASAGTPPAVARLVAVAAAKAFGSSRTIASALRARGLQCYQVGKLDDAAILSTAAIEVDPSYGMPKYDAARIYAAKGDGASCARYLRDWRDTGPQQRARFPRLRDDVAFRRVAGDIWFRELFAAVPADCSTACEKFQTLGHSAGQLGARALRARRASQFEQALCLARAALASATDASSRGALHFEMSKAWQGRGCMPQALAAIQQSLAVRPRGNEGWEVSCAQCRSLNLGGCERCGSGSGGSSEAGASCEKARSAAAGAPLTRALVLLGKTPAKPADSAFWKEAVTAAEQATALDPACQPGWSTLAFARYRYAYDICGRGDYKAAAAAARRALELAVEPAQQRVAWMHAGRIAAAQLSWDEAKKAFQAALKAGARDARSWLADLAVREKPRGELLAVARQILAGDALVEDDVKELTAAEAGFLYNAALARNGRRMNVGALDWFFYCEGSPLADRPRVDPGAPSVAVKKGSVDWDNSLLLRRQQQSPVTR